MAPRESTGTFPDQYLTFDYDVSVNLGAPPPHDPFPVTAAIQHEEDDDNNNTNPAAQDALNNVQSNAVTASEGGAARNSQQPPSQVDPLSIDPTVNQATSDDALQGTFAFTLYT